MFFLTNYSGVWPIVALIATASLPGSLIAVLWGVTWTVLRARFASWKFAVGAGTSSVLFLLAGLSVLFFWPVTPDPHAVLFGTDGGIKIFGGLALIFGGFGGLVVSLLTWGICELARHVRARK